MKLSSLFIPALNRDQKVTTVPFTDKKQESPETTRKTSDEIDQDLTDKKAVLPNGSFDTAASGNGQACTTSLGLVDGPDNVKTKLVSACSVSRDPTKRRRRWQ